MTDATQDAAATKRVVSQQKEDSFGTRFRNILFIGSLCLVILGSVGFGYLRASSPLALLEGSRRPIAAATAFIPQKSPFTFSLLVRPDELIDLQQATVSPEERTQALSEVLQIQQNLNSVIGIDYERDIQPWIGSEMTFAYTDLDLDQNPSNGRQPGYLTVFEIAPDQVVAARSFLQLFWQRQALVGNIPNAQKMNGVRVLSGRPSGITTASALVGEQFVMFANSVDVLRHSFQAAQTAQNLAQSAQYREKIRGLPEQRIGLAYFQTDLLTAGQATNNRRIGEQAVDSVSSLSSADADKFAAMSLSLRRKGLVLNAERPEQTSDTFRKDERENLLRYLPISSELAVEGTDFSQLSSTKGVATVLLNRLASDSWFEFIQSQTEVWSQVSYALADVGIGPSINGILVTKRDEQLANRLDDAARSAGYSVVPVEIGDEVATAWTRFKTGSRRRTRSSLETEILGLHLQQGNLEIFSSSLEAIENALSAPEQSLLDSSQFAQASTVSLAERDNFAYADWSTAFPLLTQAFPAFNQVQSVIQPWIAHVSAIAASFDTESTDLFIQFFDKQPDTHAQTKVSRPRDAQPPIPTY